MHLVNDINAVFGAHGRVVGFFTQVADVVDAVVAGRVDLDHVEDRAGIDAAADLALIAGVAVDHVLAVDRLGQNFGAGGFARAARAGEQIGVRQLVGHKLVAQRLRDMLLPDDVVKLIRAPFAVKRAVHAGSPPYFKRTSLILVMKRAGGLWRTVRLA